MWTKKIHRKLILNKKYREDSGRLEGLLGQGSLLAQAGTRSVIAFATDFPAARESSVFVVLNYSRLDVRELISPTAFRERRLVFGRRYSNNVVIPSGSDALFRSALPVNHPSNQRLYRLVGQNLRRFLSQWLAQCIRVHVRSEFLNELFIYRKTSLLFLLRSQMLCSSLFDDATSSRCLSIHLSFDKLFRASCKPIVGNLFARKCSSEEGRSSEASNLQVKIYHFDYHVDRR